MKRTILVFVISTILYVSAIIWITSDIKLDAATKTFICIMAIACIGFPTMTTLDLTEKK